MKNRTQVATTKEKKDALSRYRIKWDISIDDFNEFLDSLDNRDKRLFTLSCLS